MFLGVEIGGTKLQLGVGDGRGRLQALERRSVERSRGAKGILRQIEEVAPALIQRFRVRGVGVGFGGPVDMVRGRVLKSHQIAGWDGMALGGWCERKFALPTVVENDQNAAALAEACCGAGRGKDRVFYVTVGTGIGGGLVVDGKIYNGRFGAAEIGHTRMMINGRWVTVESVASGLAIERGVSTVSEAARCLGMAIANVIALMNPDVVIVGGGVTRAGTRFWRPLRQTVARYVFAPFRRNYRIAPAGLGEAVVVVGGILLAGGER